MMWGFFGGPWGWVGPVSMLLFWVLVIGGIALVLRSWWTPSGRRDPEDALSILDRRYARGEISRDDYLAMRRDLTGRDPS